MKLIVISFAFLAGICARSAVAVENLPRPNILYFYVDDMGWGAIGPNGQAQRKAQGLPFVRTPNIDRLAARGVNFRRAYACTVCSPSRASQQSGFHQGHTFSDRNDPDNAKKAMRSDDVLMGDVLSSAGYSTGYWGKWGYGGSKDLHNPVIDNVQTLPTSHGYQHVLAELHHVRAHTFFQPTLWHAPASADFVGGLELVPNSMTAYQNDADYPDTPALQNHAGYPKTAYCDDAYAFAALDFVRDQGSQYRKTGKPFFGLLAVQIPHAPFGEIAALPDWNSAYADEPQYASLAEQSQQWVAMVTRIDAHFGNILAALEDPNNDGDTQDSIASNTLVIFQSDNGGPSGQNNVQLNANGGLRGNKGQIYEGGIRVPLVMRWPATINSSSELKPGTNSDMVVDITDLLPTFCDLAQAPTPLGLDGVSIAPTLLGTGHQRRRDFIIHEAGNQQSIIRGKYKLIQGKKSHRELYDLETDHAETKNIANKHPELAKELETLLLGERVTEPKGFANTYHHWMGGDGKQTSDPDHWSDYSYSNAGVTYMTDTGAPQLSWIAHIENSGDKSNVAVADDDLKFLAVEIKGCKKHESAQALVLELGINLTGRNEIRIAEHGSLTVDGGTVSSLRWIDIHAAGGLIGNGKIDSSIYNSGSIAATGSEHKHFSVSGDFHQSQSGTLTVYANKQPAVDVAGSAFLNGNLKVLLQKGIQPAVGTTYTVLKANKVVGKFDNAGGTAVDSSGRRFKIGHSETAVTVTLQ